MRRCVRNPHIHNCTLMYIQRSTLFTVSVCMLACICTCTVCTHVCTYICTYVLHTYNKLYPQCRCVHVRMDAFMYVCVNRYASKCRYVCTSNTYVHMCTCVQTALESKEQLYTHVHMAPMCNRSSVIPQSESSFNFFLFIQPKLCTAQKERAGIHQVRSYSYNNYYSIGMQVIISVQNDLFAATLMCKAQHSNLRDQKSLTCAR